MYEKSEKSPHFFGVAAARNVFSLNRIGRLKMFWKEFCTPTFNKLVSRLHVCFIFCFIMPTGECCNTKETQLWNFNTFSLENILTCGNYQDSAAYVLHFFFFFTGNTQVNQINWRLLQTGDRWNFVIETTQISAVSSYARWLCCSYKQHRAQCIKMHRRLFAPAPAAFKALLWCSSRSYVTTTPPPSTPHLAAQRSAPSEAGCRRCDIYDENENLHNSSLYSSDALVRVQSAAFGSQHVNCGCTRFLFYISLCCTKLL